MFITIPKVFDSMGLGTAVGILFFVLVLFAAMTSSIALTESAVSTFQDELGWSRKKSTVLMGAVMITLGSLSSAGLRPAGQRHASGHAVSDFFDFLTNSVMMPIAAISICLLVSRVAGIAAIEQEVCHGEERFPPQKRVFTLMIRYLCPLFAAIILISSVANAFGLMACNTNFVKMADPRTIFFALILPRSVQRAPPVRLTSLGFVRTKKSDALCWHFNCELV